MKRKALLNYLLLLVVNIIILSLLSFNSMACKECTDGDDSEDIPSTTTPVETETATPTTSNSSEEPDAEPTATGTPKPPTHDEVCNKLYRNMHEYMGDYRVDFHPDNEGTLIFTCKNDCKGAGTNESWITTCVSCYSNGKTYNSSTNRCIEKVITEDPVVDTTPVPVPPITKAEDCNSPNRWHYIYESCFRPDDCGYYACSHVIKLNPENNLFEIFEVPEEKQGEDMMPTADFCANVYWKTFYSKICK